MLAGLAFCEMLSQVPTFCYSGVLRGSPEGGQQQFATQVLRVHLLGIDNRALVQAIFEAIRNAFKNRIFEASKLVSTRTVVLKHYFRK